MTAKLHPNEWRRERRRIADATRAELVRRFPNCFVTFHAKKKPLKLRINHDLFAACPDISKRDIKIALTDYTNGPRYQEALIEGADRIALDGSASGTVSKVQAGLAAERLKWMLRKYAASEAKRAEQQARAA